MMGLLMPILSYAMDTWNYVASCRSSSTEGASDVSPFTCFTLSFLHSGVSLFCLCVLLCLFVCFGCFVFLECLETYFYILQQLDDRPCFIARSATRKKKRLTGRESSFVEAILHQ